MLLLLCLLLLLVLPLAWLSVCAASWIDGVFMPAVNQTGHDGWDIVRVAHSIKDRALRQEDKVGGSTTCTACHMPERQHVIMSTCSQLLAQARTRDSACLVVCERIAKLRIAVLDGLLPRKQGQWQRCRLRLRSVPASM